MAGYNLMKAEDRQRMREAREKELRAIEDGSWPRDINDVMRWTAATSPYLPVEEARRIQEEHAAEMCRADLLYLAGLGKRLPL